MLCERCGEFKTSTHAISFFPGAPAFVVADLMPSQAQTGLVVPAQFVPEFVLPGISSKILTAGDNRVNENIGLAMVTTLWMREHNRLARSLKAENPSLSDEQLFQEARKLNIALYQHIVFDEYLPLLVGESVAERVPAYTAYRRDVDATTSVEFAVSFFRYGHSTLRGYPFLNGTNCQVPQFIPCGIFGDIVCPPGVPGVIRFEFPAAGQVGGTFTVPDLVASAGGAANFWRGFLYTKSEKVDTRISSVIRDLRFGFTVGNVLDIFTTDIMRHRFTGTPTYYEMRKAYYSFGLFDNRAERDLYKLENCTAEVETPSPDPIECFQFTDNAEIATQLRNVYGKVTKIDGLVGLLAEPRAVSDAFVPRTLGNMIIEEYLRSRDGDRFWYENSGVLTTQQLSLVKARSMAHIIRDNFPGVNVPTNAFRVPDYDITCNA